jgi:integrase
MFLVLKKKLEKHKSRKAQVFSTTEIDKYLTNDDPEFIGKKLAVIFGIYGGLRRSELYQLTFEDVEITDDQKHLKVFYFFPFNGKVF